MLGYILDRLPYIGPLRKLARDQGLYPLGDYSSPIPKKEEVLDYLESRKSRKIDLPDIDLSTDEQFEHLQAFQNFYKDLPFTEKPNANNRYFYEQTWFSYADAIFLYSFLRETQPKRIIEIGGGFSTAVILDTVERFFEKPLKITSIEPYSKRLRQLLRADDQNRIQILEQKVQEVPLEFFATLNSGDLLFIDSSHVVKCGSDLQFLLFQVLPNLSKGVFVHFHDVFYPFDYPDWVLLEGRYWNEVYFLRAFLSYNSEWKIHFFNTYAIYLFQEFIRGKMPLCLRNPGGSLYIRRNL